MDDYRFLKSKYQKVSLQLDEDTIERLRHYVRVHCKRKHFSMILHDDKRWMKGLSDHSMKYGPDYLKKCKDKADEQLQMIHPQLTSVEWMCLWSIAGGKNQNLHCDYVGEHSETQGNAKYRWYSAIVGIDEGSKLRIQLDGSSKVEELEINPGELLIFESDFVHGGCGYDSDNYRLHFKAVHTDTLKNTENEIPEELGTGPTCEYCGYLLLHEGRRKYHHQNQCMSEQLPIRWRKTRAKHQIENAEKCKKYRLRQKLEKEEMEKAVKNIKKKLR